MNVVPVTRCVKLVIGQGSIDLARAVLGCGGERFGVIGALKKWRANRSRDKMTRISGFKYKLSICAIMKDEGPYLKEWIAFHLIVGVEHFYLYDNGSTDDTRRIIESLVSKGVSITYVSFPGEKMQMPAYRDCVERYSLETEWLSFVDLDEMIVPCQTDDIREVIKRYQNYAQLVLKWAVYGSNFQISRPHGLVIESFTRRGPWNCTILTKSIINPRLLFWPGVHQSVMSGRTKFISPSVARVNHYHCKSVEEYRLKAGRGDVAYGREAGLVKYQAACFKEHDRNEIEDGSACRFAKKIYSIYKDWTRSL